MMSESVIQKTVKEFEVALRQMAADRHTMHIFDVGTAPNGEMWSLVILMCTQKDANVLAHFFGNKIT